jgi:prevent-host-death family protein
MTKTASEARPSFGALLDRVEAGEEVTITRRGRPVARIVPFAPRKPLDFERLAAFRATMPRLSRPSVELLRAMRDEKAEQRDANRTLRHAHLPRAG